MLPPGWRRPVKSILSDAAAPVIDNRRARLLSSAGAPSLVAAAALFGPTILTDVATATTLLALAAALTYTLACRALGSILIAAAAVAVELAASPRLYNAGKLLLPLEAVALGWRYVDAPSLRRLVTAPANGRGRCARGRERVHRGQARVPRLRNADTGKVAGRFAAVSTGLRTASPGTIPNRERLPNLARAHGFGHHRPTRRQYAS